VREFIAITDVDAERARFFLESAGWDLQVRLDPPSTRRPVCVEKLNGKPDVLNTNSRERRQAAPSVLANASWALPAICASHPLHTMAFCVGALVTRFQLWSQSTTHIRL